MLEARLLRLQGKTGHARFGAMSQVLESQPACVLRQAFIRLLVEAELRHAQLRLGVPLVLEDNGVVGYRILCQERSRFPETVIVRFWLQRLHRRRHVH